MREKLPLHSSGFSSFDTGLCSSFTGRATGLQRGRDKHDGRYIGGRLSQRGWAGQPSPSPFTTTHRPRLSNSGRDSRASCQRRTGHTPRDRVPGKFTNESLEWLFFIKEVAPNKNVCRMEKSMGLQKSSLLFKATNKTIQDAHVYLQGLH